MTTRKYRWEAVVIADAGGVITTLASVQFHYEPEARAWVEEMNQTNTGPASYYQCRPLTREASA